MEDLISKSAYREKLVDYNRHLAAREEKATAEEDYEELNAIQNECRAYFMMLSLLDDMPTTTEEEIRAKAIDEYAERIRGYAFGATEIIDIVAKELKGE